MIKLKLKSKKTQTIGLLKVLCHQQFEARDFRKLVHLFGADEYLKINKMSNFCKMKSLSLQFQDDFSD